MKIERGDAERYSEIFTWGKRAGWEMKEIDAEPSGGFTVKLVRDGKPHGTWSGSSVDWHKFCALTTPKNVG